MAVVIAILNQKGGVGKTTTAVNLASSLASLPLEATPDSSPSPLAGEGSGEGDIAPSSTPIATGDSVGEQHCCSRPDSQSVGEPLCPSGPRMDPSGSQRGGLPPETPPADPPEYAAPSPDVALAESGGEGGQAKAGPLSREAQRLADPSHAGPIQAHPRVLIVDCDPQAHASTSLGIQPASLELSTYDAICDGVEARDIIKPSCQPGLDILPANIDLAGAEVELAAAMARETRLKAALAPILPDYDIILLDTPPSLGLLTLNALTAADYVLVPVQAEFYSLASLPALNNTIRLVQQHLNPRLAILGVLITMYDPRTRLARDVLEEVRRHFGELLFDIHIPRSVRVSEAPSHGVPLSLYDQHNKAAAAYDEVARQIFIKLQFAGFFGLQGA